VTACVRRAGGEGVHAGERHFLDGYHGSGLPKPLYGNPKWHELSELVMIQRLQEQTIPAKRRTKKKERKNTVYILATHGPLSQSCSKNWLHTLPAYSAKPTPIRVEFLSASPGTPPLWPSIRKVLRCPPCCRDLPLSHSVTSIHGCAACVH